MFKFLLAIILIGIILSLPNKVLVLVEHCHKCLKVYGNKITYSQPLFSSISQNIHEWNGDLSRKISNSYKLEMFPGRLCPPQLVFTYGNVTVFLQRLIVSTDDRDWGQIKNLLDWISAQEAFTMPKVILIQSENMDQTPDGFEYQIAQKGNYDEKPESFVSRVQGPWLQYSYIGQPLLRQNISKMCYSKQRWRLLELLNFIEHATQGSASIIRHIQSQISEPCQNTQHPLIFAIGLVSIVSLLVWDYYRDPMMHRGYQSPI